MTNSNLINLIQNLPSPVQTEVFDFVEFISSKYLKPNSKDLEVKTFSFNWEGVISKNKKHYSTVKLQHIVNKWRSI